MIEFFQTTLLHRYDICQNFKSLQIRKALKNMKVITVGNIREYFAKLSGADFTEPITAGIFVSIVAWASYQRLEEEGHTVIQKGRKNIRYYVKDYENSLFDLK